MDINDKFTQYSEEFMNNVAKFSKSNGELVETENLAGEPKEIQRAVLLDRAVKKMIHVIGEIELMTFSEVITISDSPNLLREKTPPCYYELKAWLTGELNRFLDEFDLDGDDKTNQTFGDKEETSPHLKEEWKSELKDVWKDDDSLCGIELADNAKPSFAWLAMFFQIGFKSTLAFAPLVNTRMGDLDAIFTQDNDKHSIADIVREGGDKLINARQVAVFPYTVSAQDTLATNCYPSMELKSTCCARAMVDIPNNGGGLWESKKAEVELYGKNSLAFPLTFQEVNRTLLILNNYEYITMSSNMDYKKAWEFIFKKRDISTIEALKFLIIKLNLPPTILVQKQAETEDKANIGKSPV